MPVFAFFTQKPPPDNFFDDTYWEEWNIATWGEWNAVTDEWDSSIAQPKFIVLDVITTGPNVGWQTNYRPISMKITLNNITNPPQAFNFIIHTATQNVVDSATLGDGESITIDISSLTEDLTYIEIQDTVPGGQGTYSMSNILFYSA